MKHLAFVGIGAAALLFGCAKTQYERDPHLFAKDTPAGRTEIGWADRQTLIFKLCKDPKYTADGQLIDEGLVLQEVRLERASVMDQLIGATQIASNAAGTLFYIGGFGFFTDMWGPNLADNNYVFVENYFGPGEIPNPR